MTNFTASAFWLIRKFKNATKRQRETQSQLEAILKLPNPFGEPGDNYTISFFKKQWTHQRSFRADHTNEEHERRKQLIELYEHWSTLEVLKARLLDPKFHLLSKKEVNKIFDNVKKVLNELQKLEKELSDELLSDDVDNDEQRLLLLLYNSKKELYVQAVQLHAKRQPLLDAKSIGTRVGTALKEKIMKAMRDRTPAVKKLLDKFNKHLDEYLKKFPNQTLCISSVYPLKYDKFSKMPLDHDFWNNGLYFQSTGPWAIEPNTNIPTNGEVDAALEDVVLDDTLDDGEDTNEDWMTDKKDGEDSQGDDSREIGDGDVAQAQENKIQADTAINGNEE
ncbi:hypothetical protein PCANC_03358 [Puccinia coronata f. sp. avenae]|uniref:Uncharacterized protein n=1 Tax=Puccinia coronata f. sp. avenae TaxID=200324 RepID=A0A2N5T8Q8_9BASI|nr:hypothetical protein PCANC_03358 [Puccinia coronata f. sp. avenae]